MLAPVLTPMARLLRRRRQRSELDRILAALYGAGEQGIAVPDLTPGNGFLFQDSAGTTPVTAYEQPVGLILDRSKGATPGPELVTNGDFSNGATGWTAGAGWSIAGGAATGAAASTNLLQTNVAPSPSGKTYRVTLTIVTRTAGSIVPAISGSSVTLTNPGTYTFYLFPIGSDATLYISGVGFTGTITNISVKALPGNHIIQATSTKRPTLSARYNLLGQTPTLSTQSVTTTAGSYTINLSGSGSVTLSGTATGTFSAGVNTFTATAGTLTVTVSGTVTNADIRRTIDTIGQPAYQRVGAATDYDTAGFYPYLSFDGTDDSKATAASVDFTATDKMTVFAGVTKLSDAATAGLVELSNNAGSNIGSFRIAAPSGTAQNFGFDLTGNNGSGSVQSIDVRVTTYQSPISGALTTNFDLAQATAATELTMRVNGSVPVTIDRFGAASAGTGNFGNYTLFVGARNNSSNFFNGRLYPFFIRGAATDATTIAQVEQYIRARMPVASF